ncbi:lipid-A-disaccharide synthase [Halothiobacillus sp. DCM-1]|uniref:lipid-A-disaccharide synthase n=1 Tax=Halothiobacillus sp. DCM-1 TaxID=3112558 RepID=UPI00324AE7FD
MTENPPLRLFFSAGEASGDHYAAEIFQRIRARHPQVQAQGLGGSQSRAAGIETVVDLATVSVMGLVEVLRHYGRLKRAMNDLLAAMTENPPDLLIAIDFQEFNQRLAKASRARGIRVLFFVAPQVWAWRPKRAARFSAVADHLAVLFDFEVPLFARHGLPTTHTGHPLLDLIPPETRKYPSPQSSALQAQARARLKRPTTGCVIGLLPGSRRSEIDRLLPILLATAERLLIDYPDWQFILPIAPSLDPSCVARIHAQREASSPALQAALFITEGQARLAMTAADVLLIASGTATLEAALIGTPMVIVYRTHPITFWLAKHLVRIAQIGLPNIVLGRAAVPEFLQQDANPEQLAQALHHLASPSAEYSRQQAALAEIPAHLGQPGGLERLAELALKLAQAQ